MDSNNKPLLHASDEQLWDIVVDGHKIRLLRGKDLNIHEQLLYFQSMCDIRDSIRHIQHIILDSVDLLQEWVDNGINLVLKSYQHHVLSKLSDDHDQTLLLSLVEAWLDDEMNPRQIEELSMDRFHVRPLSSVSKPLQVSFREWLRAMTALQQSVIYQEAKALGRSFLTRFEAAIANISEAIASSDRSITRA
jgi:hypothetical protein